MYILQIGEAQRQTFEAPYYLGTRAEENNHSLHVICVPPSITTLIVNTSNVLFISRMLLWFMWSITHEFFARRSLAED